MPTTRRIDEFLSYIAANVRRTRLRQRLTQEELADAAECDLTYVQRIERGTANPTVRVLVALARALGVHPAALFRRAEQPERRLGRPRKRSSTR